MSATSIELDAPVRAALVELLRGWPATNDDLEQLYDQLLTALLRLVFVVLAEARGLLGPDQGDQGVLDLFEQLHADADREPRLPLDQRYEAWARLRSFPRISDRAVYRVLHALLIADGERIAYAAVAVEQLGSSYESLIGDALERGPEGLRLRPSGDRRRTGSHYTPRSLSESIVETTLAPVLDELGEQPTPEQLLALTICDPAMGSGAFLLEACRQLAERLVDAWATHGRPPTIPADDDPRVHAQRAVAQRCLYGVDKNPRAVELAKLSLWLMTLADDQPLDWLDHALKWGDSLVGLNRAQIANFDWDPGPAAGPALFEPDPDRAKRRGDAVIAALLSSARAKPREARRRALLALVDSAERGDPVASAALEAAIAQHRHAHGPALHWQLEFPKVFTGSNPGFAAVVGNPPFLGGRNISASYSPTYLKALIQLAPGTSGGTDLCAHFLRRAFAILREGGCFGLITTNTISQGDTRAGGLAVLRAQAATLYDVRRRIVWPGAAAVVVSVVHCRRGPVDDKRIDGVRVDDINSYLMPLGPDQAPRRLARNRDRCFQGNIVLGVGFTFDDGNPKASSLADMDQLIASNPANRERIFPYLGGREVNDHPAHNNHRYVINFGELSEAQARRWPELFAILERKVRPERATKDAKKYPRMVHEWWKFWNYRSQLYAQTRGAEDVLVIPLISKHLSLCRVPANYVISHKLAAFSFTEHGAFAILQSRIHEYWARLFSSTLGDGLNYSPTDCFETFPFPDGWENDSGLEAMGRSYYAYRAALMLGNDEGLTKTYNRFHDPDERDPAIVELRERHAAIDRAVLLAYGWADLAGRVTHEFVLEYDAPDQRRQPWRCKWPEALRDDVLGRLFALNQTLAARANLVSATETH